MKNTGFLITFFVLSSLPFIAEADLPTAQFLLEGRGPRAEAMGESVVSNAYDSSAWYWNPAAAACAENPQLGLNSQNVTQDINTSNLSLVYPLRGCAFGAHVISENSTVSAYNNTGQQLPSINNQNVLATVGFAYAIEESLSVGLCVGEVNMAVGGYNTNDALNVTIGTLYKEDRFSAGVVLANVGNDLTFAQSNESESQPTLMRYGVSYAFLPEKNLLCSVSKQDVLQSETLSSYGAGVEYLLNQFFALRGGVLDQNSYIWPSSGFGIIYKDFGFDFSYTFAPQELQGMDTMQLGLSYKFRHQQSKTNDTSPYQAMEERVTTPKIIPARPMVTVPMEKPVTTPQIMPPQPAVNVPTENTMSTPKIIPAQPAVTVPRSAVEVSSNTTRVTIAVGWFAGSNVTQEEEQIVSDSLRSELINLKIYTVVDKATMDKMLSYTTFDLSEITTPEDAVNLGKILNVQEMVVGTLSKIEDTYTITANVVDVRTGEILVSYGQEATFANNLKNACHDIAHQIADR